MMKTYTVTIAEVWGHTIEVQANNPEEALKKAFDGDGRDVATFYDRTPDEIDGVPVNTVDKSVQFKSD